MTGNATLTGSVARFVTESEPRIPRATLLFGNGLKGQNAQIVVWLGGSAPTLDSLANGLDAGLQRLVSPFFDDGDKPVKTKLVDAMIALNSLDDAVGIQKDPVPGFESKQVFSVLGIFDDTDR